MGQDATANATAEGAALGEAGFRTIVETSPYLYAVVRDDLTLAYISPAALDILGYRPEELVGRPATDIIHAEDFEIAMGALSQLVEQFTDRPEGGVPMPVRLIRADGTLALVELGAVPRLDDPAVRGTIVRGRPMAGQQSLDQAIEALVASSPLDHVLEYLVTSLEHELRGARVAIGYGWDGVRFRSVVAPHLPAILSGGGTDGSELAPSPWARAMATGKAVSAPDRADVAPELVGEAGEADLRSCWARPVRVGTDPDPVGCLVVWRSVPGLPLVSHEVALDRASRLTALAFERHRTEDLLRHAALHDNLTGVANRTRFFERLRELTTTPAASGATATGGAGDEVVARSAGGPLLAVLYLDLDDFKPVNDRYGHGHGDELLRVVTARIEAAVRPDDLVARLGGDEFAVLCRGVHDAAEAGAVADRLIHEVTRPISLHDADVAVGLTVGVAVGDPAHADGLELVAAADRALYAAKRAGKGQWRLAE